MASTGNQRSDIAKYVLVYDPSDGWPRNHYFRRVPFEDGLNDGHWPTDSIWRVEHRSGPNHHIVVRGAVSSPQTAEIYKGPIDRHRLNSH